MSDPRTEAVARAIAKVIITKAVESNRLNRLDSLAKIMAVNQGIDQAWPSLVREAEAAIQASDKVRVDG